MSSNVISVCDDGTCVTLSSSVSTQTNECASSGQLIEYNSIAERNGRESDGRSGNDVSVDQNCPICLEPWTDTGSHRLCSLRCGHVFGYRCIKQCLSLESQLPGRCPQCKARAATKHIRFLYTDKVSSNDSYKVKRIKKQLERATYKLRRIKRALSKQRRRTRKYKKKYRDCILLGEDYARLKNGLSTSECVLNVWKYLLKKKLDQTT